MDAVAHLAPTVGIVAACDFLAVARASFYRQRPVLGPSASPPLEPVTPAERSAPARSLSEAERAAVLLVLHKERFQDRSPAAVQATLLDEGQYLCSIRTMYRILQQEGESGERRDQLVHPAYRKPEAIVKDILTSRLPADSFHLPQQFHRIVEFAPRPPVVPTAARRWSCAPSARMIRNPPARLRRG